MEHPKNLRNTFDSIDCDRFLCPDEPTDSAQQKVSKDGGSGDPEVTDIDLRRRHLSPTGIRKNLVVLMRFKDHQSRALPSRQDIDILFNGDAKACSDNFAICGESGSVKSYWHKFSHGSLEIQSTITEWIDVPYTEAEAADGSWGTTTKIHQVIKKALDLADVQIDFSRFNELGNDQWIDAITFVHSGYAAEHNISYKTRIWSHKWKLSGGAWTSKEGVKVLDYNINPGLWGTSGSSIGRIGVICHELGHFLGVYDLYDTQSYSGQTSNGNGIGLHGLMANSWGFDYSQKFPAHISPWTMIKLGFVTPTIPHEGANTVQRIDLGGPNTIYKLGDGAFGYPVGEYLLICYTKFMKYEKSTFQGILIYHIDENAGYNEEGYPGQPSWPYNGKHYKVALLQADGLYELERGVDHGDAGDFFKQDWSLTPWGVYYKGSRVAGIPNTNTYQGGNIQHTHLTIQVMSAPEGDAMEIHVSGRDDFPSVSEPTAPTYGPTQSPTPGPTFIPTPIPTGQPTSSPTPFPTPMPTLAPTPIPTAPLVEPAFPPPQETPRPTLSPTVVPTPAPTQELTASPTKRPTPSPTALPTAAPTLSPTSLPTPNPTAAPTVPPTPSPTEQPTTPAPTFGILLVASEDFEDSNFQLSSRRQVNKMISLSSERVIDEGALGTLSEPESMVACGSNCKLAKNSKMCIGNQCINLVGSKRANANFVLGVDPMNRDTLEVDFKVWTKKPEEKGNTACVEYSVDNGSNWNTVQCYNKNDVKSKRWTDLHAEFTLPSSAPLDAIVQFRFRSLQSKNLLVVDNIEVHAMD